MGWKLMGRIVVGGYGLAWVVFLATIGQGLSNVALGLSLAAHAISIVALLAHQFGPLDLRARAVLAPTALACLYLLAYRPALDWIYAHWAMPVRVRDRVMVIQPGMPSQALVRGETVAYRFETVRGDGYYLQGGLGLDAVLARAGDRVAFFPDRCEVNGVPAARQPFMPDRGEIVVPQNHWLIWPGMDMVIRNITAASVGDALMKIAMVHETRLIGKPYRYWFGRRQHPNI